jgi:hypothetical protein
MNERPHHYRGPEIGQEAAHHYIVTDLRETARRIWTPGEAPNTFTSGKSAAGRDIAAIIPPEGYVRDAPPLTIAINQPSAKAHDALSRILAHHGRGDLLTITVLDPREAAHTGHAGVALTLEAQGAETPLFEGTLDYAMFLHFMDRSALCEPAGIRQRLGRWAGEAMTQYMEDQATMYEAGGHRHPPSFGAW